MHRRALRRAVLFKCDNFAKSGSRRPRRAIARIALEEQRLACDRRHHRGLERFRDQERRFGAFAGQEAFGVGGNENHRHVEGGQNLIDGVEAGAAVGELRISARIRPGLPCSASPAPRHRSGCGPRRVTVMSRDSWTRLSRSIAMKVSSSMISTSVAISAAISRPAASASLRVSTTSVPRMNATSSSEKTFQRQQQEGLAR